MATTIPSVTVMDTKTIVKCALATAAAPCIDVLNGPGELELVEISNAGAAVEYVKLYDSVNPTVGTTVPEWLFEIDASGQRVIPVENHVFANGISVGIDNDPGTGDGSPVNPTGTVTVTLKCKKT